MITPVDEPFKLRNLRGAVCEYLDEESGLDEFFSDLKEILEQEEDSFMKKADTYREVRRRLFKK